MLGLDKVQGILASLGNLLVGIVQLVPVNLLVSRILPVVVGIGPTGQSRAGTV